MGNLYESIQTLCQERGVKPGRVCDDLGLSRGLITDLKMGRKKSVSAETAQRIAGYFGVSVARLLGQEQEDILEQVDVAFYGDFKELNEEEKQTIRDMVRLMRARRGDD
jgi:transcriptional regulator with XRE-family HTH domain